MIVGEPVFQVCSLTETRNNILVACESGNMKLYDVNTEKSSYTRLINTEIGFLKIVDCNTVYFSTDNTIMKFDFRENSQESIVFRAKSEITNFCVIGEVLAASTMDHGINLSDKRSFMKSQKVSILPSVCSSIALVDSHSIVAGYYDTHVGKWSLDNNSFTLFDQAPAGLANPPVVHSLVYQNAFTAVATQGGLSVYKEEKLIACDYFDHDGAVQVISFARCFQNNVIASGAVDGSLMIFDCDNMKAIDCISIENEKIQSIDSNSDCIFVADTSDNGAIGIFHPEDFNQ